MITPSYSATATERVLPRLALDFTTGVLDPRVTVTRALNTATRVNSSGIIELVNADLPRFDYDPVTLAPRGLLIEASAANLYLNSELNSGVSGTPGTPPTSWGYFTTGSPAVTFQADTEATFGNAVRITPGSLDRQQFYQSISVSANTTYTLSIIADIYGTGALYDLISWFTLPAGATQIFQVDGVTVANTSLAPLGRHVLSAILTVAATAGTPTARFGAGLQAAGAGKDVLYRRPQVEANAFRSSYIPTTTTSLTRNADAVSMTGTNFSDWYNATEGTFAARGTRFATGLVTNILGVSDGTTTNRIRLYQETNNRMTINTPVLGSTTTGNGAATYGVAAAYSANGVGVACNGGTVAVSAAGAVPTGITSMDIGRNSPASTVTLNGWLQSIRYWPQRLTNAELQAFSK